MDGWIDLKDNTGYRVLIRVDAIVAVRESTTGQVAVVLSNGLVQTIRNQDASPLWEALGRGPFQAQPESAPRKAAR